MKVYIYSPITKKYDIVRKLSKGQYSLYNVDITLLYDLSSLWLYKFAQNYQAEKAISYLDLRPAFANLKRKTAWQEKLPFNISKMRKEYRRTFVMICHNHFKDYFLTFLYILYQDKNQNYIAYTIWFIYKLLLLIIV